MEEKKLYVIGIGPGAREQMTVRADRILRESQVIIGYTVYVDLVKEFYPQVSTLQGVIVLVRPQGTTPIA